jgi:tetratricopeptide (TPR) repeat protein
MAREQGAPPVVLGGMLSNYADLAMIRGDFDLAQHLHEETSQLFTRVKDEAAVAWSLNRLGDVARERGDLEMARARYEESVAKFRGLGDKIGTAGSLYDLATSIADMGNYVDAERLDSEALSIYQEVGQIVDYPRVLEALSRCAFESGEAVRALTLAGSAAAMRQTLSLPARDASQEATDRCIDAARLELTDVEATKCWMDGWGMQPEQAVAFALRATDASASGER